MLGTLLSSREAFLPDGSGNINPRRTLEVLLNALDGFITERLNAELKQRVYAATPDEVTRLYFDEVLLSAINFAKDVAFRTVLDWDKTPVDKDTFTEALASVLTMLVGRSVVIIGDQFFDLVAHNIQTATAHAAGAPRGPAERVPRHRHPRQPGDDPALRRHAPDRRRGVRAAARRDARADSRHPLRDHGAAPAGRRPGAPRGAGRSVLHPQRRARGRPPRRAARDRAGPLRRLHGEGAAQRRRHAARGDRRLHRGRAGDDQAVGEGPPQGARRPRQGPHRAGRGDRAADRRDGGGLRQGDGLLRGPAGDPVQQLHAERAQGAGRRRALLRREEHPEAKSPLQGAAARVPQRR